MAVVEGKLNGNTGTALFRSEYSCPNGSFSQPRGLIFGSMSIVIGGRRFDYVFRSNNLVNLDAAISESDRAPVFVIGEFENVTVTNITSLFTVFNGSLEIFTELNPILGRRTNITIRRPGRVNLVLSGPLEPGIILIGTSASCPGSD